MARLLGLDAFAKASAFKKASKGAVVPQSCTILKGTWTGEKWCFAILIGWVENQSDSGCIVYQEWHHFG